MVIKTNTEAMVVTMDRQIEPVLCRIAGQRRWTAMIQPSRADLMREIRWSDPRLLLFQISASPRLDEALGMIALARDHFPAAQRIALGQRGADALEIVAREAGAAVYLSVGDDTRYLQQILRTIQVASSLKVRLTNPRSPPKPASSRATAHPG